MPQNNTKALTAVERYEAQAIAEEALARLTTKANTITLIQTQFGIDRNRAAKVVREAEEALLSGANAERDTERRRNQHVARLEALYRAAIGAKKHAVCAQILGQLGKALGVVNDNPVVLPVVASPMEEEFAGRSVSDLEYFGTHGAWPTPTAPPVQLPATATPAASASYANDPLKGLH
jgi:hypothetical protein